MLKKLVLIGCGNIGSRHLQAIAKTQLETHVDVVEPDPQSQHIAKMRLNEINYDKSIHKFFWHDKLDSISEQSDLVIVSTTSKNRVDIILNLLKKNHSRFLIEKMVCQSKKQYDILLKKISENNAKGWVNTNRRYVKPYQELKKILETNDSLDIIVTAGNVGLGSNAIHFLDLFSWFCSNNEIKLDGKYLSKKIFESKRKNGFLEIGGTLICNLDKSLMILLFSEHDDLPVTITILGKNLHIVFNETEKKILNLAGKQNLSNEFDMLNVSSSSKQIIEDILLTDNCLLPTVSESFKHHDELFKIFNKHLSSILKEEILICPIS